MAVSLEALDALQIVHSRSSAGFLLRHHLQPDYLVLTMDISRRVDPPDLMLAGRKSKLRKRDTHLETPAFIINANGRFPDAGPRIVCEKVGGDNGVSLDSAGADV